MSRRRSSRVARRMRCPSPVSRQLSSVRGAAPTDRREGSIETQIIRRVSDRPHAAVDGAALASSPGDLEPGADLCLAVERITIFRTTLEI